MKLYRPPAAAIRRANTAMHAHTSPTSTAATAKDHGASRPASAATSRGVAAIAPAGAVVATDCASTPNGPRLRRRSPAIGERARSTGTPLTGDLRGCAPPYRRAWGHPGGIAADEPFRAERESPAGRFPLGPGIVDAILRCGNRVRPEPFPVRTAGSGLPSSGARG